MKGFDDHLDNYGDPNPSNSDEAWQLLGEPPTDDDDKETNADGDRYDETPVEWLFPDILDDGITSDDFDNWPGEWNWS